MVLFKVMNILMDNIWNMVFLIIGKIWKFLESEFNEVVRDEDCLFNFVKK